MLRRRQRWPATDGEVAERVAKQSDRFDGIGTSRKPPAALDAT
jgi:hypothetical protein